MISYIKGTIEEIYADRIIIEANRIGYNVFTTAGKTLAAGEEVKIYTYLSVREDAMHLYGFLKKEELTLFRLMLGVSGIGPKGALNILSSISAEELQTAVLANDAKRIAKAQGIGLKTAQKLILELKDKLNLAELFESEIVNGNTKQQEGSNCSETVEALTALGYSPSEALKAVNAAVSLIGADADTETLLKAALKQLA